MKEPLVSIITPLYNSEKYISETIESVLSQTYSNWEMIVIDDCSTDNSEQVVKDYILKNIKIKYIKLEENSGSAIARNVGISNASGKYISFLDSDDTWSPEKLQKQISFMEKNKYYFTYTNYSVEKNNRIIQNITSPKEINYKKMLKRCSIGCLTAVYNREFVGNIKITKINKRTDYAIWLKVLKKCNGYLYDENLAKYKKIEGSISSGSKIKLLKYHYVLFRKSEGKSMFKSLYLTLINSKNYIIHNMFTRKEKNEK